MAARHLNLPPFMGGADGRALPFAPLFPRGALRNRGFPLHLRQCTTPRPAPPTRLTARALFQFPPWLRRNRHGKLWYSWGVGLQRAEAGDE